MKRIKPATDNSAPEVITFRATPELIGRIDEWAAVEGRSRANLIAWILGRVTDPALRVGVLETIVRVLYDELEKRGENAYTEFGRGQLHAAKWMLTALLGGRVKDATLMAVRKKLRKPIPHCVPKMDDGNRYGFDSDAG